MDKTYLFVYGTLRMEYGLKLMQDVAGRINSLGVGKIKAKLFDLGSYPAAIKGELTDHVWGDVYELLDEAGVLPLLDEYEGHEYKRESVEVALETGAAVNAWVYWFAGNTDTLRQIKENDYLIYLKNKE